MVDVEVLIAEVHCLDDGHLFGLLVFLPWLGVSLGLDDVESLGLVGLRGFFCLAALVGLAEVVLFGCGLRR